MFCDLSLTPRSDGASNVYDDIRKKLIARGIPAEEIKFIHEADTEAKKQELFKKGAPGRSPCPDRFYRQDGRRHKCAK